jgi:multidrug efflux pump subunit AcrA (membrane-fusion protein)
MIVRLDDDFRIGSTSAGAMDQATATLRQNEAKIGLRPGQKFNPENVPEVAAARSALDLADKNLRRYEKLVETGDISRAAYDQQKSQRDQLAEQYQALIHQAPQNYAAVANAQRMIDAAQTQLSLAETQSQVTRSCWPRWPAMFLSVSRHRGICFAPTKKWLPSSV